MGQWRGSWFRAVDRAFRIEDVTSKNFDIAGRELAAGERRLGAFVLPHFQRKSVWTLAQKVRLIESFLDELPVPGYVVNSDLEPPYTHHRWLLDGQQRITAILDFLDGEFPVRGIRFPDVETKDQRWFLNRPFHCLETNLEDENLLLEVYDRLAYGGTEHTADDRKTA